VLDPLLQLLQIYRPLRGTMPQHCVPIAVDSARYSLSILRQAALLETGPVMHEVPEVQHLSGDGNIKAHIAWRIEASAKFNQLDALDTFALARSHELAAFSVEIVRAGHSPRQYAGSAASAAVLCALSVRRASSTSASSIKRDRDFNDSKLSLQHNCLHVSLRRCFQRFTLIPKHARARSDKTDAATSSHPIWKAQRNFRMSLVPPLVRDVCCLQLVAHSWYSDTTNSGKRGACLIAQAYPYRSHENEAIERTCIIELELAVK
jgi:hypothetical protein